MKQKKFHNFPNIPLLVLLSVTIVSSFFTSYGESISSESTVGRTPNPDADNYIAFEKTLLQSKEQIGHYSSRKKALFIFGSGETEKMSIALKLIPPTIQTNATSFIFSSPIDKDTVLYILPNLGNDSSPSSETDAELEFAGKYIMKKIASQHSRNQFLFVVPFSFFKVRVNNDSPPDDFEEFNSILTSVLSTWFRSTGPSSTGLVVVMSPSSQSNQTDSNILNEIGRFLEAYVENERLPPIRQQRINSEGISLVNRKLEFVWSLISQFEYKRPRHWNNIAPRLPQIVLIRNPEGDDISDKLAEFSKNKLRFSSLEKHLFNLTVREGSVDQLVKTFVPKVTQKIEKIMEPFARKLSDEKRYLRKNGLNKDKLKVDYGLLVTFLQYQRTAEMRIDWKDDYRGKMKSVYEIHERVTQSQVIQHAFNVVHLERNETVKEKDLLNHAHELELLIKFLRECDSDFKPKSAWSVGSRILENFKKLVYTNVDTNESKLSCDNELGQGTIVGKNVILSDFINFADERAELRLPCEEKDDNNGTLKELLIFATSTVYIDRDILGKGRQLKLAMVGAQWDIIGQTRNIRLDGNEGEMYKDEQALEGELPGENGQDGNPGNPGGNGGSFLGIFHKVSTLGGEGYARFHISANGAMGGRAQIGGNGATGVDGKNVTCQHFPPVANYTLSNSFVYDGRLDMYYLVGEMGFPGGDGGAGGPGGRGGHAGKIKVLSVNRWRYARVEDDRKISTESNNGSNGNGAHGGRGGDGGLTGRGCACKKVWSNGWRAYQWQNCIEIRNSSRAGGSQTGRDNREAVDTHVPPPPDHSGFFESAMLRWNNFSLSYKFAKSSISWTENEFIEKVGNDEEVDKLISTPKFISDSMESLNRAWHLNSSRLNFPDEYISMLGKIDKYFVNQFSKNGTDAADSKVEVKVVNYLYIAVWSKYLAISQNPPTFANSTTFETVLEKVATLKNCSGLAESREFIEERVNTAETYLREKIGSEIKRHYDNLPHIITELELFIDSRVKSSVIELNEFNKNPGGDSVRNLTFYGVFTLTEFLKTMKLVEYTMYSLDPSPSFEYILATDQVDKYKRIGDEKKNISRPLLGLPKSFRDALKTDMDHTADKVKSRIQRELEIVEKALEDIEEDTLPESIKYALSNYKIILVDERKKFPSKDPLPMRKLDEGKILLVRKILRKQFEADDERLQLKKLILELLMTEQEEVLREALASLIKNSMHDDTLASELFGRVIEEVDLLQNYIGYRRPPIYSEAEYFLEKRDQSSENSIITIQSFVGKGVRRNTYLITRLDWKTKEMREDDRLICVQTLNKMLEGLDKLLELFWEMKAFEEIKKLEDLLDNLSSPEAAQIQIKDEELRGIVERSEHSFILNLMHREYNEGLQLLKPNMGLFTEKYFLEDSQVSQQMAIVSHENLEKVGELYEDRLKKVKDELDNTEHAADDSETSSSLIILYINCRSTQTGGDIWKSYQIPSHYWNNLLSGGWLNVNLTSVSDGTNNANTFLLSFNHTEIQQFTMTNETASNFAEVRNRTHFEVELIPVFYSEYRFGKLTFVSVQKDSIRDDGMSNNVVLNIIERGLDGDNSKVAILTDKNLRIPWVIEFSQVEEDEN